VAELIGELRAKSVTLVAAGRSTQWHDWAHTHGFSIAADVLRFPTLREALTAYRAAAGPADVHPQL
jgi:hypothetical protein